MTEGEKIRSALKSLSKKEFQQVFPCTVTSVDEAKQVCDVTLIENGLELFEVRLRASIDGESDGVLIVPAVGSTVLVALINDNPMSCYVAQFSQVQKVVFHDGSFGGFCKTQELKTQLDKTNECVQALMDTLTNWTPVAQDGGAALKTAWTAASAGKAVGDYGDIENDKITHGE